MWIFLVCLYGGIKGVRDIIKKKSLEINSIIEVLFFYTFLSFLFVTPGLKTALKMDMQYMGFIILKSFIIFVGWIFGFRAIKKMPVSLYGIMDMSRVIFATILGVFLLNETFTISRSIGMGIVLIGLLLVNIKKSEDKKPISAGAIIMVLICCLCNATSEILDKFLMPNMNSTQLQFWYMLYLTIFYFIYIIFKKVKINWHNLKRNHWILWSAILFVIGDKALFIACASPNSTVIAITLIKQCSVLVTIIGGKFIFNEKNIIYRLFCAFIVIAGIMIAIL